MKIRVLYFGVLREKIAGVRSEQVDLAQGSTLRDLFTQLSANHTGLDELLGHVRIAVNEALASPEQPLADGDEVAMLPPMAGGADHYYNVTDEPLNLDETVDAVAAPSRGAIVTFIGRVRDSTGRRKVTAIEYEAYRSMALQSFANIIQRCEGLAEDVRVAIAHRTGTLEVGQTVVIIAAAAPRRTEAFQAARSCAELMKWETAVWRKEIGPDGYEWIGAPADLQDIQGPTP